MAAKKKTEDQKVIDCVRRIIRAARRDEEPLRDVAPNRSTGSRHVLKRRSKALDAIEEVVRLKRR